MCNFRFHFWWQSRDISDILVTKLSSGQLVFDSWQEQQFVFLTRGTNLMQKCDLLSKIISTWFGHLYAHLQEYRLYATAYGVQHQVLWLWFQGAGAWSCALCVALYRIQTYTQCTRLRISSLGPQPQHLVLNTICSSIQPVLLKMGI
jgi:hypothetical protein